MKANYHRLRLALVKFALLFLAWSCCSASASQANAEQEEHSAAWNVSELSFRALDITSIGNLLWVCGTDESIAVSADDGVHWRTKHSKAGGGLLLGINFVDSKFGYAAGTGGLILTTTDAGQNWTPISGPSDIILQASFVDEQHGIVRTDTSLLFTTNGTQWAVVSAGDNLKAIERFPYTFSLVALNVSHMAVMLKQGPEQYETQAILYTMDSGVSWKFLEIPNVTLYSFLRINDRYWAVGTEVVHKDAPGGGYGVPVALSSVDGEIWSHFSGDLSSCKPEMCTLCKQSGCVSSNGSISRILLEKPTYAAFPANKQFTSKWASTDSALCFVSTQVACAAMTTSQQMPNRSDLPIPTLVAPEPLGRAKSQTPRCISCEFDHLFVDAKVHGQYKVKLILGISKNGTVMIAEALDGPTTEIKSRIEQQARQWIFEPYVKDGLAVNVKLNTSVTATVIGQSKSK